METNPHGYGADFLVYCIDRRMCLDCHSHSRTLYFANLWAVCSAWLAWRQAGHHGSAFVFAARPGRHPISRKQRGNLWRMGLGMVAGLLIDYAFGTAWFMLFYAKAYGAIGLWAALSLCVIPFILPDLVKIGLALTLTKTLPKRIQALR